MSLLRNGDRFPALAIKAVAGGTISLPDDLAGFYSVVLFYRGAWCPYCNAQLAAFSRAADSLATLGIKLVALSADDDAAAAGLVAKYRLGFPVGYGADVDSIAAATGAFTNDNPRYLQSTGFILDRHGRVVMAVYSSGALGRLLPDDVAGFIRYLMHHEEPPARSVAHQ